MIFDIFVSTDGSYKRVRPANRIAYTLDELREFVGGPIEVVHLNPNAIIVVNEEGKLRGLPYNDFATNVLYSIFHTVDYIVGNVLICSADRVK